MQLQRQFQESGEFCIDTLTFSLNLSVLADGVERFSDFDHLAESMMSVTRDDFTVLSSLRRLAKKLFPKDSITVEPIVRGIRNLYEHHVRFADSCGYIAFGGNNTYVDGKGKECRARERLTVHLTGEGCRRVFDFHFLYEQLFQLSDYEPSISRLDIAFDDHSGSRSVDFCRGLYQAGEFTSSGRPPKAQYIDDCGTDEGCTFYVGKRENGKQLCVYEKGKQLGDSKSGWVRWEGRIYSKDRIIPLDA
ncbi:MAG: replication initiation factor domain-containing protein, partial [Patescibacteria group bacterium]